MSVETPKSHHAAKKNSEWNGFLGEMWKLKKDHCHYIGNRHVTQARRTTHDFDGIE